MKTYHSAAYPIAKARGLRDGFPVNVGMPNKNIIDSFRLKREWGRVNSIIVQY